MMISFFVGFEFYRWFLQQDISNLCQVHQVIEPLFVNHQDRQYFDELLDYSKFLWEYVMNRSEIRFGMLNIWRVEIKNYTLQSISSVSSKFTRTSKPPTSRIANWQISTDRLKSRIDESAITVAVGFPPLRYLTNRCICQYSVGKSVCSCRVRSNNWSSSSSSSSSLDSSDSGFICTPRRLRSVWPPWRPLTPRSILLSFDRFVFSFCKILRLLHEQK